ncbi:phage tail protein [Pediococcus claussenii]|uniref:phage tail protein n=1 Tax=Pediococcus claussenii TaxID=187452 RepID=UPI00081A3A5B|nr:phage tail protein [Pediococcus claussenii]ANZ70374.1 hypothetical protein AYR57_08620 [Pediococcus claussenii]ANZ72190.1 hypothetical protein AYR58_08620 [Pediococcus claussenii]
MAKPKDGGYVGVSYARFSLKDANGKTINDDVEGLTKDNNGIYTVTTTEDGGVASANLTGLAPTVTRIWGNNEVADISVGQAQPSVALTINFLNHIILNKILGRKSDGKGGYDIETNPVSVAMDIVSTTVAGGEIHFGFFNGYVTPGELNLQTNNENSSRVTDALTFTPFSGSEGKIGKIYYIQDEGYDKSVLESEIFGADSGSSKPATPTP